MLLLEFFGVIGVLLLVIVVSGVYAWHAAKHEFENYYKNNIPLDRVLRHKVSRFCDSDFDADDVEFYVFNGDI